MNRNLPPLLYVVGAPATGKSTLMAALRAPYDVAERPGPVPHMVLVHPSSGTVAGAEIGRVRDHFSGTDALRMDIQPHACRWLEETSWPMLLGEGARLGTKGFLTAARDRYRVHLVHLEAPEVVLNDRCARRGSRQALSYRRGAATRARRLAQWAADEAGITVHLLDGTWPTGRLAAHLRTAVGL